MKSNNVHTFTARTQDPLRWISQDLRAERLPSKLGAMIEKVRPIFKEWLVADTYFERNTATVAGMVRKAWETFKAEADGGGRVAFARMFDEQIAEDAKTRDLADNATYNRLNYLIDHVGKDAQSTTTREPVIEKRKRIHSEWLRFRKQHAKKPIELSEVEELLAHVLTQIWNEEAVKEVIAA